MRPRTVLAPNPSAMTLDGTRTYIVGRVRTAIIDPGSSDPDHIEAIAAQASGGNVVIIITHDHPDHSAGAHELSERLNAPVLRFGDGSLADDQLIDTDEGALIALHTPGHTPDHISLHWPAANAVFCGDLMMGGLDTALVAPPEGALGPYLASLDRIGTLSPAVIYPAHGPPFENADAALARYRAHRHDRERQVIVGLGDGPHSEEELMRRVYGDTVEPALVPYARAALQAYLEHLEARRVIRKSLSDLWMLV